MIDKLIKIEKLINSELTSKVQNSFVKNQELLIEINEFEILGIF